MMTWKVLVSMLVLALLASVVVASGEEWYDDATADEDDAVAEEDDAFEDVWVYFGSCFSGVFFRLWQIRISVPSFCFQFRFYSVFLYVWLCVVCIGDTAQNMVPYFAVCDLFLFPPKFMSQRNMTVLETSKACFLFITVFQYCFLSPLERWHAKSFLFLFYFLLLFLTLASTSMLRIN